MSMKNGTTLTLALMLVAAACADPVSPSRTLVADGPFATVTSESYWFPPIGTGFPNGAVPGDVQLCKTANAGGTFNFTASTNGVAGNLVAAPQIVIPTNGGTVCTTIYNSGNTSVATIHDVTITEAADQSNWSLTAINTRRLLAQGLVNNGVYTAAHLADVENLANRTVTVKVNDDMARIVTFTNTYTPPQVGSNGCTPGYWKQSHHFDSWPAGYTPSMSFNTALGLPGTNLFAANFTLLQALGANGGGKNALARHAAAAILNAASGFYPMTVADVKAAVLAAYNNASLIEAKKDILANNNELGCPLN